MTAWLNWTEVIWNQFHQLFSIWPEIYIVVDSRSLLLPGGGFSICQTPERYCCAYLLRGHQDPEGRLNCCFLTVFPLSPHPLCSLISSCLILPFGTENSLGGWMKPVSYTEDSGTEKGFCALEAHTFLLSFKGRRWKKVPASWVEEVSCFCLKKKKRRVYLMITDYFQKSLNSFDHLQ